MKKWKSDLLRIDAVAYEAKRRYEHKLKKQRTIVPLRNKNPHGFTADEWYRDTFGENDGK